MYLLVPVYRFNWQVSKNRTVAVYCTVVFSFHRSGAVTKQFVPAKNLVANFILESFFSHSQVRQYLEEKKGEHLTPEHLGEYGGKEASPAL